MFSYGGTIAQSFVTRNGAADDDIYYLELQIDTTNMQAGDSVAIKIYDITTATTYNLETITSNVSCVTKTYNFNSPNWKGHSMQVRIEGAIASSSTIAKVDTIAFWQAF